jgi:hypothetical protein
MHFYAYLMQMLHELAKYLSEWKFWTRVTDKNKTFHIQDSFPVSCTFFETMQQIGPYGAYIH